MIILEHQEKVDEYNRIFNDIIDTLESNRFEPSERGAGTAPNDFALKEAEKLIKECIKKFKDIDLDKVFTFEDIINEINLSQQKNICNELYCLKEIDDLPTIAENKFKILETVYQHIPSGKYLLVTEERNYEFEDTISIQAKEVIKKETVSYKWSQK